jgi:hypothetical protein
MRLECTACFEHNVPFHELSSTDSSFLRDGEKNDTKKVGRREKKRG